MNHCAILQKNAMGACEEMKRSTPAPLPISSDYSRDSLVCPKPRRVGLLNAAANDALTARPLHWHFSQQSDLCDSKAGADLLDIILSKGSYGGEQTCTQVASSPPFFSGSPPSRVANPLIQDERFAGDDMFAPATPPAAVPACLPSSSSSSSSSSSRKGGCIRASFGDKPAVRIEGFDCLDRDRRNCSIPALA